MWNLKVSKKRILCYSVSNERDGEPETRSTAAGTQGLVTSEDETL